MTDLSSLGLVRVKKGDVLTLRITDPTAPARDKNITLVAAEDIDFSKECALYYAKVRDYTWKLITDKALTGFIEDLVQQGKVYIPALHPVIFGDVGKVASRLQHEYRFSINPEQYWKSMLDKRYAKQSFDVLNHQGHHLTVLSCDDPSFFLDACLMDKAGEVLGTYRFDMVCESKNTLISDSDCESLRLALQSDLALAFPEQVILVDKVFVVPNATRRVNPFKQLSS